MRDATIKFMGDDDIKFYEWYYAQINGMDKSLKYSGTVDFSDKIIISDPGYKTFNFCNVWLKVKPGKWDYEININSHGRPKYIKVTHSDNKLIGFSEYPTLTGLGVDSGTISIIGKITWCNKFDNKEQHDYFWKAVRENCPGKVFNDCVATSTGGDISTDVFLAYDEENRIVGIKIALLGYNED